MRIATMQEVTRETVVDLEGLAEWLGVSRRIAERMDLPFFMAGKRQRFLIGQCIDVLAERARSAA
jgi:hypothetical protein